MSENELYKPNHYTYFNPKVIDIINKARLTKDTKAYIDCLYGEKSADEYRKSKEKARLAIRKSGLGFERAINEIKKIELGEER